MPETFQAPTVAFSPRTTLFPLAASLVRNDENRTIKDHLAKHFHDQTVRTFCARSLR
jgi:hypothetical protein